MKTALNLPPTLRALLAAAIGANRAAGGRGIGADRFPAGDHRRGEHVSVGPILAQVEPRHSDAKTAREASEANNAAMGNC